MKMTAKRFLPIFVLVFALWACAVPSISVSPAAITPTIQADPTLVITPTTPLTPSPTNTLTGSVVALIPTLPAGAEIKISNIHMLNATSGWATGGFNGQLDHILRTADGAQTWKDVTPPEPAPTTPESFYRITAFFQDDQHAWAAFSQFVSTPTAHSFIWRTADGGSSWQLATLTDPDLFTESYTPSDLFFVDAQHGWMMVHVGVGMNHDYFVLLSTTDGGLTWQTLLSPPNDTSGLQGCYKSGLAFVSPQDGWITVNCHGVVDIPFFFKTQDAGVTWQSINLPAPSFASNAFPNHDCEMYPPILFSPTNAAIALTCTDYSSETRTQAGYFYHTTDGGTSWKVYPYPGGDVHFLNSFTAFSLGRSISRSDDTGETWKPIRQVNWDGQFSFTDSAIWVVATDNGQTALVKSTDGGSIWEEIKPKMAP